MSMMKIGRIGGCLLVSMTVAQLTLGQTDMQAGEVTIPGYSPSSNNAPASMENPILPQAGSAQSSSIPTYPNSPAGTQPPSNPMPSSTQPPFNPMMPPAQPQPPSEQVMPHSPTQTQAIPMMMPSPPATPSPAIQPGNSTPTNANRP